MFVTFCPHGGAIFRSLEIVDENDVQWDQSSPGNSASHYSDQSMIKLDFSAA